MTARLLMLVSCMTLLGCGQLPGHPKPGPEVPRPDSVLDFATLYAQNCSGCHGAQGMNGPSYPLANPAYQALVDEQIIRQIVTNGEPGTHMPPFAISAGGMLTDQQVDALVNGVRAAWFKAGTLDGANAAALQGRQAGGCGARPAGLHHLLRFVPRGCRSIREEQSGLNYPAGVPGAGE